VKWGIARLKTAAAAMRCPEAWRLPPRVALALFRSLSATRPVAAPSGTVLYVNCPAIGTRSFRRYLRGIKQVARGEHIPLVAHISVTDRCVNRCARCSNISPEQPDPPLDSLVQLLHRLQAAGAVSVAFTGGEPLLRNDLPQIIGACGDATSSFLFTSGHALDDRCARDLRSAGLTAAFISLDHYDAPEHDRIRGNPGAFDRAVNAIRACVAAGIYTAAQAVVEAPLLCDATMERFLAFCRRLGVHEVMLLEPMSLRVGGPSALFGQTERERLRHLHVQAARDGAPPKVTTMSFLDGPDFLGCQAGFTFLYVSAGGEVFPCDFAPVSFGNIYTTGWDKIHARMKQYFPRPSQKCFANHIRELAGEDLTLPLLWKQTEALMRNYDPGDLPGLMKSILRDRLPIASDRKG
jgi:MoaA/NifB/PqqE/SkfB family radical SAM enzyme